MPIDNVIQADFINIDNTLRLRGFDNEYNFAFQWYQKF